MHQTMTDRSGRKRVTKDRGEAQLGCVNPIGWMCCFLLLVGLSLRAGSQPPSMGQYLEGLGYRAIRTKPVRWWGGCRVDGRLEGKRVEFYCFPGAAYSLVDPSLTNRLKRLGELGVTLRGRDTCCPGVSPPCRRVGLRSAKALADPADAVAWFQRA